MEHIKNIRSLLAAEGLDAVLLTEEANRFYATGFLSPDTDGVALITRHGAYFFTDARYTVAAERALSGVMSVDIVSSEKPYSAFLSELIKKEDLLSVGIDGAHMTFSRYESYKRKLDCVLTDISDSLSRLRCVKDAEELRLLRHAQRITDDAFTAILPHIRVGVSERELAARLQYEMLRRGAEKMSFDPIVVSGENGAMPHGVPSDKRIASGEFVTMDFGCVADGYCSDMTRTVAVGSVSDEMRRVYETVLHAQTAAIAATRPGVSGAAVDAVARRIIGDAGYGAYFSHSYGHGVGVEIHELPTLSPHAETLLPVGAVASAEPGIYLPHRFGVRIEDLVVLTETACENLTASPKNLLILPEK